MERMAETEPGIAIAACGGVTLGEAELWHDTRLAIGGWRDFSGDPACCRALEAGLCGKSWDTHGYLLVSGQ